MAKATKKAAAKKPAAKKAVKKASPKKKQGLSGYDIKSKKNVPMQNASIQKKGNRYVAKGETKDGRTLTSFVGADAAKAFTSSGAAKKIGRW